MQVQKPEVRSNILNSAMDEFYEYGFSDASIRRIAQKAGVTPGNIYAYFSSKNALFDSLLEQTLHNINLFVGEFSKGKNWAKIDLRHIAEGITKIFLTNKKTFMILMNGSKGTRYENMKQELFLMIKKRILNEYMSESFPKMRDTFSAEAFSVSLMEGIFYLFNHFDGNEKKLLQSLNHFMTLIFGGRLLQLQEVQE